MENTFILWNKLTPFEKHYTEKHGEFTEEHGVKLCVPLFL